MGGDGVQPLANEPSRSTETVRALRALHVLVQLTDNDAQSRREDVRDRLFKDVLTVGGRILNYVPIDSYLVLLPCVKAAYAISRLSYISWIGRLRGESKLAPEWGPILRHYKTSDNIKEGSYMYDMIDVDKEGRPMVTVVLPDQGSYSDSKAYASFIHSTLCVKFSHFEQPFEGSDSARLPDSTISTSALNQSLINYAEEKQHLHPQKIRDDSRPQPLEASEDSYCSTFSVSLEGISTTTTHEGSNRDETSTPGTSTHESSTSDEARSHQRGIASQDLVILAAPKPLLPAVLQWLQQQGWVQWIAPRPRSRLHNRWASAVTQSASTTGLDENPGFGSTGPGTGSGTGRSGNEQRSEFGAARPLWRAGITGSGQIVGIGDSGIDMQSCFFRDDTVPLPGSSHRKVVQYRVVNGDTVDELGHGTHVAGSVAGACSAQKQPRQPGQQGQGQPGDSGSQSMDLYPGMAPDARIAFTDMGEGDVGYIMPPADLGSGYYGQAMRAGAFIHSDSWASGVRAYDYMAQSVDRFTFYNPNFLPVVAAGNMGSVHKDSISISSPALSKNCLTVGATLGSLGASPSLLGTPFNLSILAPSPSLLPSDRSWYPLLSHAFGTAFQSGLWEGGVAWGLARGEPRDGCGGVRGGSGSQGGSVAGMVVLLDAGNCLFADKLKNAQAAGAAAAVIVANDTLGYFPMAAPFGADPSITIPGGSVPQAVGTVLDAALRRGQPVQVSIAPLSVSLAFRPASMARFSSWGPTPDGRIKPDITAPGEGIWSAKSNRNLRQPSCAVTQMSGTSMATPITAGSAALLRQYFMDGFYPTGERVPANGFVPSGMLLKATLINGATALNAANGDRYPIDAPPSMNQGFGRVHLSNAVPIAGTASFTTVAIEGPALKTGNGYRICLLADPGRSDGGVGSDDIKVTLAWYDAPAALVANQNAATPLLVNNLDLSVTSPAGHTFFGNGGAAPDTRNTVEQVHITAPQLGVYTVDVRAAQVNMPMPGTAAGSTLGSTPVSKDGGQRFAIAARGPITQVDCLYVRADPPPPPLSRSPSLSIALLFPASPSTAVLCSLTRTSSTAPAAAAAAAAAAADMRSGGFSDTAADGSLVADDGRWLGGVAEEGEGGSEGFAGVAEGAGEAGVARGEAGKAAGAAGEAAVAAGGDTGDSSTLEVLAWGPCSSPVIFSPLDTGTYVFSAQLVDASYTNTLISPLYSNTFAIDLDAPSTTLTSSHTPATAAIASFSFSSPSVDVSHFQCQLSASALSPPPANPITPQPITFRQTSSIPTRMFKWLFPPSIVTQSEELPAISPGGQAPRLDITQGAATWSNCSSPVSYTGFYDGRYSFSVRAVDLAGNADPTPPMVTWTLDTVLPKAVILEAPPVYSNQRSVQLVFGLDGDAASVQERGMQTGGVGDATSAAAQYGYSSADAPELGGAQLSQQSQQSQQSPQSQGPAEWSCRLQAWSGATSPPPLFDWSRCSSPFQVGGVSSSNSSGSNSSNSTSSNDNSSNSSSSSSSSGFFLSAPLSDGTYLFSVRATSAWNRNGLNNASARAAFTVDSARPRVLLLSHPPCVLTRPQAVFSFFAPKMVTFTCLLTASPPLPPSYPLPSSSSLASSPSSPSSSPLSSTTSLSPCVAPLRYDLPDGKYTWQLSGVDWAGNKARTKVVRFAIDRSPPTARILSLSVVPHANSTTNNLSSPQPTTPPPSATLLATFTGSDGQYGSGVSGFLCHVALSDSPEPYPLVPGAWAPCSSPLKAPGLSPGRYRVLVVARDWGGMVSTRPAVGTFTVLPPLAVVKGVQGERGEESRADTAELGAGGDILVLEPAAAAAAAAAADVPAVSFVGPFPAAYSSDNSTKLHFVTLHNNKTSSNEDRSDTSDGAAAPSEGALVSIPPQPSTPLQSPPPFLAWPCSSPVLLPSLPDGQHQLFVRPVGALSSVGAWACFSWTVDTTPPSTSISWANHSVPGVASSLSPTVRVLGREEARGSGVVRLECRLESMMGVEGAEVGAGTNGSTFTWQPCVGSFPAAPDTPPTNQSTDSSTLPPWPPSPSQLTADVTLASLLPSLPVDPSPSFPTQPPLLNPLRDATLPDGVYAFSARAVDASGNADPHPPSVQFVVNAWALALAGIEQGEEAESEGDSGDIAEILDAPEGGSGGGTADAASDSAEAPSVLLSRAFPVVVIACDGRCTAMLPSRLLPGSPQQSGKPTLSSSLSRASAQAPAPAFSLLPSASSSPSSPSAALESLMAPSASSSEGFRVVVGGGEGGSGALEGGVAAAHSPAAHSTEADKADETPLVFRVISDVVSFAFPPALPPLDAHPPPPAGLETGLDSQRLDALGCPLLMLRFTMPAPCEANSGSTPCGSMQLPGAEPASTAGSTLVEAAAPIAEGLAALVPSPEAAAAAAAAAAAGSMPPAAAPAPAAPAASTSTSPPEALLASACIVFQAFSLQEVLSSAMNASLPAPDTISILFHPHTTPTSPPSAPSAPSPPSAPSSSQASLPSSSQASLPSSSPSPSSGTPPLPPSSPLQPHRYPPVGGWQVLDSTLLWQQGGLATFTALRPGLYTVAIRERSNQPLSTTLSHPPPAADTTPPPASGKAWVIALVVSLGVGALVVVVGLAVFFVRVKSRGRAKVSPHLRK
ncbi:hypothetical protein CLOM_g4168 [Closterium sp. NIES-68]|nr:hypothetical protein CLOM_g4168 [Closterium sp. NIES-68]GJP63668.1 hypothetical protein CLOP_g20731 [Closterium sp. NIES-67]